MKSRINKTIKHFLRFFKIMGICFVLFWSLSLLKCEFLTYAYYEEFEFAYESNSMFDEIEYFKVLSCCESTASVYYVSKDMTRGDVLTFTKENGAWKEVAWKTIYSTTGSASDVIWPYWYHVGYGGL